MLYTFKLRLYSIWLSASAAMSQLALKKKTWTGMDRVHSQTGYEFIENNICIIKKNKQYTFQIGNS